MEKVLLTLKYTSTKSYPSPKKVLRITEKLFSSTEKELRNTEGTPNTKIYFPEKVPHYQKSNFTPQKMDLIGQKRFF